MKPSPVPIALSMLLIAPTVRADAFVWAKQLTSTINCSGVPEGVALDSAGNVYVAGHFCGTADFDPGPGTQVRAAASRDAYVLKLDSAGRFLWVAQLGTGPMATQAFDLVVDPAGNVAVTGTFLGTVDFDPGAATFNLTSAGNLDVFVVKLDSSGALLWARQVGSTGLDSAEGIATDPAGNIYAVGLFNGTVDFDPGVDNFPLNSSGLSDAFILKLDSSGGFSWARRVGGTGSDRAIAVALDGQTPTFVGSFSGTGDFDPGAGAHNLTASGPTDVFVCRLTVAGIFDWARQLGGSSTESVYDVAVGALGEIFTVGEFTGTADFDPNPGSAFNLTATGSAAFISKLNAGGSFLYAKQLGGATTPGPVARSVAFVGGNVYTTGTFRGNIDFDPGPGNHPLSSALATDDAFISKLDGAGNYVWAGGLGGASDDHAYGVAVSSEHNIHTVGTFRDDADFDPGSLDFVLNPAGNTDSFISRLSPSLMGGSVSGLMVRKSGATDIRLDWSPACTPSMPAYGVYEGVLGDFDSHFARACFFGLVMNITFTPGTGSSYYLVVPNDDFDEGSYGRNSAGVERPTGVGQCMSQVALLACP